MLPLRAGQGVGVLPLSRLARGRLTRDWGTVTDHSARDEPELGDKEFEQLEQPYAPHPVIGL